MPEHHYYLLHKPHGYLSQFISNGHIKQRHKYLGELHDFAPGTMSVGRLDLQSEGLLLLTTDGKFSHDICKNGYEKEYYVQVDGEITEQAITDLILGVEISINGELYQTLPAQVQQIDDPQFAPRTKKVRDDRHGPSTWVSVIITEGKFRQVRKMCAVVGFPVLRLVRVRVHNYLLSDLELGEVREIELKLEREEKVGYR